MLVYKSEFLEIDKRDNVVVSKWLGKGLTTEIFQNEITHFVELNNERICSKNIVWQQENLDFIIPNEMHQWINEDVIKILQKKIGPLNLAFTIPKEQSVFFALLDSFKEVSSTSQPAYFANESLAIDFVNNLFTQVSDDYEVDQEPSVNQAEINLKVKPENLPYLINHFKETQDKWIYTGEMIDKFTLLTTREAEVFDLITKGYKNSEIAERLYITKETVSSHRKNLIRKLDISNLADWINYANLFNLKSQS